MNITKLRQVVAIMFCLASTAALRAQTDTIRLASHDLKTDRLKEGLHQYLVYFENPKKRSIAGRSSRGRSAQAKREVTISANDEPVYWSRGEPAA